MITWGRRFANPLTESIENVARSGVNPAFAERREQERQVQERARETQQNDATLRVLGNAFNGLMQAGMRRTNKEGLVYTRNNNDKRPVPTPRTVIVNTTKVIREECQNKHSENPEEKKEWKIAEDRLERERINMTREIMEELNRKGPTQRVSGEKGRERGSQINTERPGSDAAPTGLTSSDSEKEGIKERRVSSRTEDSTSDSAVEIKQAMSRQAKERKGVRGKKERKEENEEEKEKLRNEERAARETETEKQKMYREEMEAEKARKEDEQLIEIYIQQLEEEKRKKLAECEKELEKTRKEGENKREEEKKRKEMREKERREKEREEQERREKEKREKEERKRREKQEAEEKKIKEERDLKLKQRLSAIRNKHVEEITKKLKQKKRIENLTLLPYCIKLSILYKGRCPRDLIHEQCNQVKSKSKLKAHRD
ncbi:uncharacterized protein [Bemisia tabaci]|uniref:uncharacterized protein n=1 Tax=Bemisia tabaci TaxID=7038 RepID=UPI003B27DB5D